MRYGAMNFPVNPVLEEIALFAAMGFDYLELALDPPQAHYSQIQQLAKDIRRALDDNGMGLVCHLPTFVFTADLTASIRQASLDEMLFSLETAKQLDAEKVVLHPSMTSGLGAFVAETVHQYAAASLHVIINEASRLGLTLCLENMFPRYGSYFRPDDFTKVLNAQPDLRITLDVGHANIQSPKGKRIFDFISTLGKRIGHVHFSDNLGLRDDHLPLGKGTIPHAKVVQALRGCGYDDTLTLEVFGEDRNLLARSLTKIKALFS